MRSIRVLLVGAALAAAAFSPSVVVAGSGDTAGGSGRILVTGEPAGGGTFDQRLSIGSHESNGVATGVASVAPDGTAHGVLVLDNTFINASGTVIFDEFIIARLVCLEVNANLAIAAGVVVRSSPGSSIGPGQFLRGYFQDNGQPVNGQPVDLMGAEEGSVESCVTRVLLNPITSGNYTVQDGGV